MSRTALLSLAVRPRTEADKERLSLGLSTLMSQDPALSVATDHATGDVVIGATGELHLETVVDRLKREFKVQAAVGRPQIAYKETLTRPAEGEMQYTAQNAGRGEYAHAKIRVYPGESGAGYVFENLITGGAIPEQFIKPIDDAIRDSLARGVLAGYPIDDIRVVLDDGSYHDVDSSEAAFRIAASGAFHEAAKKATPVLLEPIMRVEVVVPTAHISDVMADLSSRRGRVQAQEAPSDAMQLIVARAPLSEMFGYATTLRFRTFGRGTCTMQFERYEPVPPARGRDLDDDSMVGAPRKPKPTLPELRVALPEPADDELGH